MIQLNVNHRPNTVYLKGIGRPIKNINYRFQNYPATLLVGRMTQIKPGNIKVASTSFSDTIKLQCYASVKIDSYLQLFMKLFKTVTLAK